MADQRDDSIPRRNPLWRKTEQAFLAMVCGLALVLMVFAWWRQGGQRGELIEIDRAPPTEVNFLVDANSADWPELAQLPDIGEGLARRIVASRESEGPFQSVDDLQRVSGIGPRTLAKIRPYIRPIAPAEVIVGR